MIHRLLSKMNVVGLTIGLLVIGINIFAAETNTFPAWLALPRLVWGEATNGVRAGMTDGDPGIKGVAVFVAFAATNRAQYVAPPGVRFAKVKLCDSRGMEISPVTRSGLYGELPARIRMADLPRFADRGSTDRGSTGGLRDWLRENPATLQAFRVQDSFRIKEEGDYQLTVWSAIYGYVPGNPFVSRLDLPAVTIVTHLAPQ